ncbi:MAG: histone deacetylase family protein, partial [Anaerolineales bacterium]|nr:histone deacetylase family protein [Anaerolineales bacterium]
MLVVYSKHLEDFRSPGQIHFGAAGSSPEVPERTQRIAEALQKEGLATFVEPRLFPLEFISSVHDESYLNYLQTANRQPITDPESDGQPAAVLFPAAFPFTELWPTRVGSVMAAAGAFCFDTYAPLTAQVWPAALLAAHCALTAAELVRGGEKAALALCRPPGHHAMRAKCGGFCYLNNAAIAAQFLSQGGPVAILDVDYHHGNGTQEIFYTSNQVLYVSLHADPKEAYPYFSGYAEETGAGAGLGFNWNIPLPPGTDDARYRDALSQALTKIRQFAPQFLVLSLGFDICHVDPLSTFRITPAFFGEIARRISTLNVP